MARTSFWYICCNMHVHGAEKRIFYKKKKKTIIAICRLALLVNWLKGKHGGIMPWSETKQQGSPFIVSIHAVGSSCFLNLFTWHAQVAHLDWTHRCPCNPILHSGKEGVFKVWVIPLQLSFNKQHQHSDESHYMRVVLLALLPSDSVTMLSTIVWLKKCSWYVIDISCMHASSGQCHQH